jgi:hypothetical protein
VCNPTEASQRNTDFVIIDDDEQQAEEIEESTAVENQLASEFGDDFDVEVLLTEAGYLEAARDANEREIAEEIRRLEADDIADNTDHLNRELIQAKLRKLLPTSNSRESTMQAFNRLTEKSPWFPLRSPDDTSPATELDKAEAAFFESKSTEYKLCLLR